jgi:hypothetical protein
MPPGSDKPGEDRAGLFGADLLCARQEDAAACSLEWRQTQDCLTAGLYAWSAAARLWPLSFVGFSCHDVIVNPIPP